MNNMAIGAGDKLIYLEDMVRKTFEDLDKYNNFKSVIEIEDGDYIGLDILKQFALSAFELAYYKEHGLSEYISVRVDEKSEDSVSE